LHGPGVSPKALHSATVKPATRPRPISRPHEPRRDLVRRPDGSDFLCMLRANARCWRSSRGKARSHDRSSSVMSAHSLICAVITYTPRKGFGELPTTNARTRSQARGGPLAAVRCFRATCVAGRARGPLLACYSHQGITHDSSVCTRKTGIKSIVHQKVQCSHRNARNRHSCGSDVHIGTIPHDSGRCKRILAIILELYNTGRD